MLPRSYSQKANLLILLIFTTGFLSGRHLKIAPSKQSMSSHIMEVNEFCDKFEYPQDLVVIVKTGANEVYDKIPTQLLSCLSCYPNILIFSDLEQRFRNYPIHDALKNVPMSIKKGNAEFNYYRKLQYFHKNGEDISSLRQTDGQAAWDLDKYKFLHMLEDTWELQPNRKWYVFIEADTYLFQSNLFHWLDRLDPTRSLYFGSHAYHKEVFAHGGSGFILSGAALSQFLDSDRGVIDRFDQLVKTEPFGDYVLTQALLDEGINLTNASPMLQNEKPSTLPFGPGPGDVESHWCRPLVTMHHITPQEASMLWEVEQQRANPTSLLLYRELYNTMIKSDILAYRTDWDNLSEHVMYRPPGVEGSRQKPLKDMTPSDKEAHLSFEQCGRACEEDPRCFQYMYTNHTCGFSWFFRLGRRREPEGRTVFKSGWNLARIAQYQAEHVCTSTKWV